ncbi:unnamed protein product [Closterium sp. Yama58-4]|nr:unnamed protein product [Closterium sp. Yama58-4]
MHLSMDDFLCPICRDLVFKPVVNGAYPPAAAISALLSLTARVELSSGETRFGPRRALPEASAEIYPSPFEIGLRIPSSPTLNPPPPPPLPFPACGHVFCFCESRCPMCRRAFAHFPSVCWLLHRFLSSAFPAELRARARDVADEERAMGTFSPSAPPAFPAPSAAPAPPAPSAPPVSSAPSLPQAVAEPLSRAGARKGDTAQEARGEGRAGEETGEGRAGEEMGEGRAGEERGEGRMEEETGKERVGEGRGERLSAEGAFLAFWQQQFSCGVCRLLLLHPVVLNCGHVVCSACSSSRLATSASTPSLAHPSSSSSPPLSLRHSSPSLPHHSPPHSLPPHALPPQQALPPSQLQGGREEPVVGPTRRVEPCVPLHGALSALFPAALHRREQESSDSSAVEERGGTAADPFRNVVRNLKGVDRIVYRSGEGEGETGGMVGAGRMDWMVRAGHTGSSELARQRREGGEGPMGTGEMAEETGGEAGERGESRERRGGMLAVGSGAEEGVREEGRREWGSRRRDGGAGSDGSREGGEEGGEGPGRGNNQSEGEGGRREEEVSRGGDVAVVGRREEREEGAALAEGEQHTSEAEQQHVAEGDRVRQGEQQMSEGEGTAVRAAWERVHAVVRRIDLARLEGGSDGGSEGSSEAQVEALMRELEETRRANFIHISVGCDGCGAFPIVGARYRCLDCPERVGFDLCAACYSCPPPVVGRFNQRHVSTHRMVEVRQRDGMWHRIFESVHPELMARLMASIEEEEEADQFIS